MHEVLVNLLGGLSLPRKSVVMLTDRPDMTLDHVYRGRKTLMLQKQPIWPPHPYIVKSFKKSSTPAVFHSLTVSNNQVYSNDV